MNKKETVQVITLLAGNYDSIAKKDNTQKQLMIGTWLECLGDLDYRIVLEAVKKSIIESPYPPTIHDVRKNAIELTNPSVQRTAIEAWNEAHKMICNGLYMTEEQFDKASPEVKRFFGSVRQVTELAKSNIDTINTVTKGQFLKQYDALTQQEEKQKLIPEKMKEFTRQLVKKVDIRQLEK